MNIEDFTPTKGVSLATVFTIIISWLKMIFGLKVEIVQSGDVYLDAWENIVMAAVQTIVVVLVSFYFTKYLNKREERRQNK